MVGPLQDPDGREIVTAGGRHVNHVTCWADHAS